ncbi:oxidative stress-induced growth inhibitor 1 isoform X2 [Parasteatoda tepidariorum]|nr:oxidative stress-induced growth inhibitor 1 isoform X1 [Parasteatoda tepidariorum]XP_015913500.1 oxidative stress-induced growth inhibitor 1 isoform X1 [Parasteatoda tepidariorum]XP_015913501.1 oxidative stress-induced growth inhibitor 1 isoform X1 [Parasteatoda tepidariorum]XP_042895985.1 oxidative stress-induced growth inhibitor 1 isoform X1 [Parasteatoda tepidariorum]
MEEEIFKDVVIIGNGPSGITLSYMLAGNWPYYNGSTHPIDFLNHRLQENKEKSILEQDLDYLAEGLDGRSLNPVSVLYDTLVHPQADLGIDTPSVISWKFDPLKAVNHVVIGRDDPGGSWQKMDKSALTLSHSSWMELPSLNIQDWDRNRIKLQSGLKQKRANVRTVANYYHSYVQSQGLSPYFLNRSVVTSVLPVEQDIAQALGFDKLWRVYGYTFVSDSSSTCKNFKYITPHVVLATGNSDKPNMLNVEGENLPFVSHSSSNLETLIRNQKSPNKVSKLLIVGAGLSAADAVITARFYGIPTIHVFRRSVCDPDLIFNKIPQDLYPEYYKVYQMMQDSDHYEGYKAYSSSKIECIKPNGRVMINSCKHGKEISVVNVSHVLVLIGRQPDLSYLPHKALKLGINPDKSVDCKKNPVDINLYNHESVFYPGIFAVGPLVGDNFVRFVQGGCLAVASHVVKTKYESLLNCCATLSE